MMGASGNTPEQSFHIGSPGRGPPELGRMLYHDGEIVRGMTHGLAGTSDVFEPRGRLFSAPLVAGLANPDPTEMHRA